MEVSSCKMEVLIFLPDYLIILRRYISKFIFKNRKSKIVPKFFVQTFGSSSCSFPTTISLVEIFLNSLKKSNRKLSTGSFSSNYAISCRSTFELDWLNHDRTQTITLQDIKYAFKKNKSNIRAKSMRQKVGCKLNRRENLMVGIDDQCIINIR